MQEEVMQTLLNVKEAADYLGLAVSTIYKLVSWKRIPFYKLGARVLFSTSALDKWVERHVVKPFDSDFDVYSGGGNDAA